MLIEGAGSGGGPISHAVGNGSRVRRPPGDGVTACQHCILRPRLAPNPYHDARSQIRLHHVDRGVASLEPVPLFR